MKLESCNISYDIGCPFFIQVHQNATILCEVCKMKWPDKESRKECLDRLCLNDKNYKNCPFYQILSEYYNRLYNSK